MQNTIHKYRQAVALVWNKSYYPAQPRLLWQSCHEVPSTEQSGCRRGVGTDEKAHSGEKCLDSGSFMQFQVGEFMCAWWTSKHSSTCLFFRTNMVHQTEGCVNLHRFYIHVFTCLLAVLDVTSLPGKVNQGPEPASCLARFWHHFSTSILDVFLYRGVQGSVTACAMLTSRLLCPMITATWEIFALLLVYIAFALVSWYLFSVVLGNLLFHGSTPHSNAYYSTTVTRWFSTDGPATSLQTAVPNGWHQLASSCLATTWSTCGQALLLHERACAGGCSVHGNRWWRDRTMMDRWDVIPSKTFAWSSPTTL